MNSFRNVHVYDGQLKSLFTPILTPTLSEDEIIERSDCILSKIKSEDANNCVKLILSQSGNKDDANNLNAFDILIEVCLLIYGIKDNNDLISLLDEQLCDCYRLGQCPQGRTTRLMQIYQLINKSSN